VCAIFAVAILRNTNGNFASKRFKLLICISIDAFDTFEARREIVPSTSIRLGVRVGLKLAGTAMQHVGKSESLKAFTQSQSQLKSCQRQQQCRPYLSGKSGIEYLENDLTAGKLCSSSGKMANWQKENEKRGKATMRAANY